MSPLEFSAYLEIAKRLGVEAFKLGDLAVEFGRNLGPGSLVEEPPAVEPGQPTLAGSWKRGPDLSADSEWD